MTLSTQDKSLIIEQTLAYMEAHKLTPNAMVNKCGVNGTYLHYMLKGETKVRETEITDKWYLALAEFIGHEVEKRYVEGEMTPEFKVLISMLEQARDRHRDFTFIAETGMGKTYIIDLFKRLNPTHTYVVTLDDGIKPKDIIDILCEELNLPLKGPEWKRKMAIIQTLRLISLKGGKPVVVFDESENVKLPIVAFIKSLYDGIKKVAGIGIVGTPQYLDLLRKLVEKNKQGAPQLASRFEANTVIMPTVKRSLDIFINKYTQDNELKKLLKERYHNYRVLTDVLEVALRQADKDKVPLTEDLFRLVHNIPKLY